MCAVLGKKVRASLEAKPLLKKFLALFNKVGVKNFYSQIYEKFTTL